MGIWEMTSRTFRSGAYRRQVLTVVLCSSRSGDAALVEALLQQQQQAMGKGEHEAGGGDGALPCFPSWMPAEHCTEAEALAWATRGGDGDATAGVQGLGRLRRRRPVSRVGRRQRSGVAVPSDCRRSGEAWWREEALARAMAESGWWCGGRAKRPTARSGHGAPASNCARVRGEGSRPVATFCSW